MLFLCKWTFACRLNYKNSSLNSAWYIDGFICNSRDFLQNTIDKINNTKFRKIIYKTRAIQNLVKKKLPQELWIPAVAMLILRFKECSIFCEKAFVSLLCRRVPILKFCKRFASWAMQKQLYGSVSFWAILCVRCFRKCWHWFPIPPLVPTLRVWMNLPLHLTPAAGTCVSSGPLAPWILQMLSCSGNTKS